MLAVDCLRLGVSVGCSVWVKYPDIKISSFKGAIPYSIALQQDATAESAKMKSEAENAQKHPGVDHRQ